jgi:hypothetical protein
MATHPNHTLAPTGIDAVESSRSAVNWGPIFAGAAVAIASTLILLALGSGLGFAVASPWPGAGVAATTFVIGTGIWLIVTQWLSSFLGGYIAGRMRTRWTNIHTDEVFFRDTAHGFLAWAVSAVLIAGIALNAAAGATSATASMAATSASYGADTMLRSNHPSTDQSAAAVHTEIARILARDTEVDKSDRTYLASAVSAQTGLSQDEARQRVDGTLQQLREAADKARKASSAIGFFTALSMVIGAFIASVAAAYGGRQRDDHEDRIRLR